MQLSHHRHYLLHKTQVITIKEKKGKENNKSHPLETFLTIVRCSSIGIKSQIVSHLLDSVSKYWWKPRRAFFSISRILIIIPEPKRALTLNLRLEFRQNQKKLTKWKTTTMTSWWHNIQRYLWYNLWYNVWFVVWFSFLESSEDHMTMTYIE